jgi:hypothetical protein
MNAIITIENGIIKTIDGEPNMSDIQKLLFLRKVIDNELDSYERSVIKKEYSKQTNIIDQIAENEKTIE